MMPRRYQWQGGQILPVMARGVEAVALERARHVGSLFRGKAEEEAHTRQCSVVAQLRLEGGTVEGSMRRWRQGLDAAAETGA
jgi:hypothetical protein